MIWGAFSNACQGMNAMSIDLGTISQNISNMNTTGYKRSETRFSTVMSEGHAAPSTYLGNLNIFGVQTSQRNLIDSQGSILASNTATDLAINGQGFFMVAPQQEGTAPTELSLDNPEQVMYTRAGNFTFVSGENKEKYFTVGGNYLLGWMADDTGVIDETNELSALYTMPETEMPGRTTTTALVNGNLPRDSALANVETGDPATRQNIPMAFYDSEYNQHTVTLGFERTDTNTWNLYVNGGEGDTSTNPTSPIEVTFDENGNMITDMPLNLTMSWDITDADGNVTSSTTGAVTLDLGELTQYDAAAVYVDHTTQDGYGVGQLDSAEFNAKGEYVGSFDNGQTRVLFKVPLANFVSDNNLEPVSGTYFKRTSGAGDVTVSSIGQAAGMASFVTSSLEGSTVVVEDEFTRMIMTQKAYSTNAQVFKTADEMTTTARDLKS